MNTLLLENTGCYEAAAETYTIDNVLVVSSAHGSDISGDGFVVAGGREGEEFVVAAFGPFIGWYADLYSLNAAMLLSGIIFFVFGLSVGVIIIFQKKIAQSRLQ